MKNSGKGPSKSQSRRPSKEENGDGWIILGREQKATLPEQHWSGILKDNAGEVDPCSNTWQRTLDTELEMGRLTWGEAKRRAQNRDG